MNRDLLSILDLSAAELEVLLGEAANLKMLRKAGRPHEFLKGKALAMVFEKASTRTRISFETGMYELGGHALFLNPGDLQIGRGEEIRDTARVMSRYVAGIMIRAYHHEHIEEFARWSSVPVINGLSDREHPCQIIADLMTIREHFGTLSGLRVAWVGDGNNVCNSLVLASALTGYELTVASPVGFQPPGEVVDRARAEGGSVSLVRDPVDAVADAHVVVTDTWVSMGEESEKAERLKAFSGYTVTSALMRKAGPEAIFLHCLPAHRGQEVADEVIEGPLSLVFDEAENRLHSQKALLVKLMGKEIRGA
ncbi:MAG TPA: ornithine carbamoyltransferase [Methanoregulaceae archaeon]|nr:MAG: ornithine carbamoyltransferase [Methanolinea sp.]HON81775.1 ornithine carbamoyltransferase [Methanoregulaceae archaeon]HPD10583.1 ornithine carbamoyltransferase [Methanoregulaceae archaeon]HRT15568.1 ornithine carbamoyltransferase [Methanoregulaceae archaeon]HRU31140.1 ornithine carbamoyltransferase [Methanoregulaceae archaeon]